MDLRLADPARPRLERLLHARGAGLTLPELLQTPYLFHVPTECRYDLGHSPLAWRYWGKGRCDLRPLASNDGRTVTIDSPHLGQIGVGAILDGERG